MFPRGATQISWSVREINCCNASENRTAVNSASKIEHSGLAHHSFQTCGEVDTTPTNDPIQIDKRKQRNALWPCLLPVLPEIIPLAHTRQTVTTGPHDLIQKQMITITTMCQLLLHWLHGFANLSGRIQLSLPYFEMEHESDTGVVELPFNL